MEQYNDSSLFDNNSVTISKITITKRDLQSIEIIFDTSKFILNASIGSGKSTTLMKHINETKNNNYIIVFP